MSFATSIGQHSHVHLRRRTVAPIAAPTAAPAQDARPVRTWAALDDAVADERQELEQWSAAYMLAVGLNR